MPLTPEALARQQIDAQLVSAGWIIQDVKAVNLSAGPGIALREVHLKTGPCDYVAREIEGLPACLSEYTVTEDKIVYTGRNVSISFLLSDLVSITEDPERVELFFGADKGLCVIPLRAFQSPDEKSLFLASLNPSPPTPHCP